MAANANNYNSNGFSNSENEKIYRKLEKGVELLKVCFKRKPERVTFCVKLETCQILLLKYVDGFSVLENSIDLQKVQEVRIGKNSKAFERWPDETRTFQNNKCFVIMYGSTFILKSLSCIAKKRESEMLVKIIQHLASESKRPPYPLLVDRWLCKEFYCMENQRGLITMKDLKAFLPHINAKLTNNRLKKLFKDVDAKKKGKIDFEGFGSFYYNLIHDAQLFDAQQAKDGPRISLQCFQTFLIEHQKDLEASDQQKVCELMREHLQDPIREDQEPYFTISEFVDFLFSKQNDAWDAQHDEVNQDMTQPIVNYWIASSHNTYLTGDQMKSQSSTEAYARCLRMGCRCIELDCWDGPDNMPRLYHGRTLTSKIKFVDVLKTIREHAFVTSEYPVILSIENHCSIPQQRNMAVAFLEVLGDLLLVEPIEQNGTQMPSPEQLKRRIIIKHKKPPDENEEEIILQRDEGIDVDISNAVKNGILYLEDPVDPTKRRPHFFMLTENKMYYTEVQSDEDEDYEDTHIRTKENAPNEEIDFGELWFHGKLAGGCDEAEELLHEHDLGDGSFLVHESEIFVGDYSLSFWRQGTVHHCHIKSRRKKGRKKYFLCDKIAFDNLHSLVSHYQSHQFRSSEFSMSLTEPVPCSDRLEEKEWFHSNMTRAQAEAMLLKVPYDGAYLVRPSEKEENCFAISFRAEDKIKHCRIKQDGRLYTIGTAQFVSLVELVNYYEKNTLYRKVKLKYPVNEQVVLRIGGSVEAIPSGGQRKRSIDVVTADITSMANKSNEFGFRIVSPYQDNPIDIAATSKEEMLDWVQKIRETAQSANETLQNNKNLKRPLKIAKELASLVVYCRTVPFNAEGIGNFTEMSSFSETKMEKFAGPEKCKILLNYHRTQFSRIYPKGSRIDSSNYDPVRMWNVGTQMVALNYQTADKPMQLNHARFLQNGKCGYVLKPKCMLDDNFDPFDLRTLKDMEPINLIVTVIAARHLRKKSKGLVSPFIEVEIIGAEYDYYHFKTSTKVDNGFNPVWKESFRWKVHNPELAIIRFVVQHEDMFGDPDFLAQAAYPLTCLRTGFRSISLKNEFSEEIELSSLLVHIDIRKHSQEDINRNPNTPSESSRNDQQRVPDERDVLLFQTNQRVISQRPSR